MKLKQNKMNATKKIVETAHNQIVRRLINNITLKPYVDELYYLLKSYDNINIDNDGNLYIGNVYYITYLNFYNICK